MTKTQKALRGIGNCYLADVKPKVARRLKANPRYRDRFLDKQARNLAAAAKRGALWAERMNQNSQ